MIDDGKTVLAVQTTDFFVDVDKPWHVLEANNRLVDYLAKQVTEDSIAAGAKISDAAEINGHVVLGKNTVIGPASSSTVPLSQARTTISQTVQFYTAISSSETSVGSAIIAMSAVVPSAIGVSLGTVPRWQVSCSIRSISTTIARCPVFSDVQPILAQRRYAVRSDSMIGIPRYR